MKEQKFILQIKASPNGQWVDGKFVTCTGHEASVMAAKYEADINRENCLFGDEMVQVRARTFTRVQK